MNSFRRNKSEKGMEQMAACAATLVLSLMLLLFCLSDATEKITVVYAQETGEDGCPVCPVCESGPAAEISKRKIRFATVNFIASFIEPQVEKYNMLSENEFVEVEVTSFDSLGRLGEEVIDDVTNQLGLFDGFFIPPILTGDIDNADGFYDLRNFVRDSSSLSWSDVLLFFRDVAANYNNKVVTIPIDGDVLLMYYRSDLLEEFDQPIPRTWEEYAQVAEFFDGMIYNGTRLYGSCLGRTPGCAGGYWNLAVLASYTQSLGSTQGALIDPRTDNFSDLVDSPALEEAVELIARQYAAGPKDIELDGYPGATNCIDTNEVMFVDNEECVLTYNWGNFFPKLAYEGEGNIGAPAFGVTILPGSEEVLERSTGTLVKCIDRPDLCPHAKEYVNETTGETFLVNHTPYAAFGGWAGGVNNYTSAQNKEAAADFIAWLTSPTISMEDVIPEGGGSTPFQPYRQSHLGIELWTSKGYNRESVEHFSEATLESLNSQNVALDIRAPQGNAFLGALDSAIYEYLNETIRPTLDDRRRHLLQGSSQTPSDVRQSLAQSFQDTETNFNNNLPTDANNNVDPGMTLRAQVQKDYGVYTGELRDDSGGDELSGGAIAGIVIGCIAGFAIILLLFYYIVKKKESKAHIIPYDSLSFGDIIGEGSFGTVYAGQYIGTEVAIKQIIVGNKKRKRRGGSNSFLSGSAGSSIIEKLRTLKDVFVRENNSGAAKGDIKHQSETVVDVEAPTETKVDMNKLDVDAVAPEPDGPSDSQIQKEESPKNSFNDDSEGTSRASSDESGSSSVSRTSMSSSGTKASRLKAVNDEIKILTKLRHPKICLLMGASFHDDSAYLVMEYCTRGALSDLLSNPSLEVDNDMRMSWMSDVATGMYFLHSHHPPVIHRDLKTQNILIDEKFTAKVADFGLSIYEGGGITDMGAGTVRYMSPERLEGKPATPSSDVFSFSIILWEVFEGSKAYPNLSAEEIIEGVKKDATRPEPVPLTMSNKTSELMQECWAQNPARRPDFKEVRERLDSMTGSTTALADRMQGKSTAKDEKLLFKMLPVHVATALRDGQPTPPEKFECVTILFSDIVNYTKISSSLEPEEVMDMLNRLYEKFDQLVAKYELFKVETVGDAYMIAGGIQKHEGLDHADRIMKYAVAAVQAGRETPILPGKDGKPDFKKLSIEGNDGYIDIRVGIHSGPIVASVVGDLKPRYALFGDTINVAARMETSSIVGRVQCTEKAIKTLKNKKDFKVESRGEIEIKGKGKMKTFFVNGMSNEV